MARPEEMTRRTWYDPLNERAGGQSERAFSQARSMADNGHAGKLESGALRRCAAQEPSFATNFLPIE